MSVVGKLHELFAIKGVLDRQGFTLPNRLG